MTPGPLVAGRAASRPGVLARRSGSGLRMRLALFLVSAASVGYEIALTRYFAVAKWSEYGYWVISIVMAGFALSGVALSLARPWAARHGAALLRWLPAALLVAAAAGFHLTAGNPFNPLQLQNAATWAPQIGNIALYYAALLPFFFLTGLFVGVCFILDDRRIGLVYGFDLTGAGTGAALTLALMWLVPPFDLVAALLPLLALAGLASADLASADLASAGLASAGLAAAGLAARGARASAAAACLALVAAEALLLLASPARYNDFKAIYAPLHVQGSAVLSQVRSPRGFYELLDDFTERVDDDLSNDAALLGLPGPPSTLGLYRDGGRIAGLPRGPALDVGYAAAGLDALPYALLRRPSVLMMGASGGFRARSALALGAADVTAIEPDPVLRRLVRAALAGEGHAGPVSAGPAPADEGHAEEGLAGGGHADQGLADQGLAGKDTVTQAAPGHDLAARLSEALRLSGAGPLAAARSGRRYDLVDISADFADSAEAGEAAFTTEALASDLRALRPGGLLSIPVSIRDLPAYALRGLAAVRDALAAIGVADPAPDIAVVRSAWNVRILVAPDGLGVDRVAALRRFCDDRSFDVSYVPGLDVAAARPAIYNDLPAVSFDEGTITSGEGAHDAVADEAQAILAGQPTPSSEAFDLRPATLDRPFAYDILRLAHLRTVLRRLELLPQAEIGQLVNVAVLAQAVVLAALVLLVPLLSGARIRGTGRVLGPAVTFASLGLGFLFIEMFLIGRASLYLEDRTAAFSLVLTGMLVFSGVGSMLAGRVRRLRRVGAAILAWCVLVGLGLEPLMLASLGWPWVARAAGVLALLAPVSVALGVLFPLALARGTQAGGAGCGAGEGTVGPGFLPWAWALNGAFSVVATPLANLVAFHSGYGVVLLCGGLLYGLALLFFPRPSAPRTTPWLDTYSTSPGAPR